MSTKHKNTFKVPEGYFEDFMGKLSQKLAEPEIQLPGDDGFSVPEGYFDEFTGRLHGKLQPVQTRVVRIWEYKRYLVAAAAVAAIVALLFMLPESGSSRPTFEGLAGTDIANYMENNELELTDDEIAQLLPLEDLEINDMLKNQLREENILEYLDGSVEDMEDLTIEYDE